MLVVTALGWFKKFHFILLHLVSFYFDFNFKSFTLIEKIIKTIKIIRKIKIIFLPSKYRFFYWQFSATVEMALSKMDTTRTGTKLFMLERFLGHIEVRYRLSINYLPVSVGPSCLTGLVSINSSCAIWKTMKSIIWKIKVTPRQSQN